MRMSRRPSTAGPSDSDTSTKSPSIARTFAQRRTRRSTRMARAVCTSMTRLAATQSTSSVVSRCPSKRASIDASPTGVPTGTGAPTRTKPAAADRCVRKIQASGGQAKAAPSATTHTARVGRRAARSTRSTPAAAMPKKSAKPVAAIIQVPIMSHPPAAFSARGRVSAVPRRRRHARPPTAR